MRAATACRRFPVPSTTLWYTERMSDTDDSTAPLSRTGSGADLARRMDRMEARQDATEAKLGDLTVIVTRVEENQKHSDTVAALRHDAMATSLGGLTSTVDIFIKRIEGILTGEVQTAQSKQGQALIADFTAWRSEVDRRLRTIDEEAVISRSKQQGVIFALSGAKAMLLLIAAFLAPVVAVIIALTR
jgi:hypothetical protein